METRPPRGEPATDKDAIATARSILLYLLSVGSVVHALQAWEDVVPPSPLVLALWAGALGAAQIAGDLLAPHLQEIEEVKRERIRFFAGIVYLGLAVPCLLVSGLGPSPVLARLLTSTLASLQPAFLLLAALGRERKGVLANALILSLLACIPGGSLATLAATSTVALLGFFLVFDHYFRTLTTHPTGPGRWLDSASWEAALTVAPVVLGLLVFLGAAPPVPPPESRLALGATGKELDAEGTAIVILIWVGGASAVYLAGRLLGRARRKRPAPLEVIEPIRGGVEHLPPPADPEAPANYPGRRGRIVRAYASFLSAAARAGLVRKPYMTAREFANVVKGPPGPLHSLTEAFAGARYGPAEPADEDVLLAERDADLLVHDLRLRGAAHAKPRRAASSARRR